MTYQMGWIFWDTSDFKYSILCQDYASDHVIRAFCKIQSPSGLRTQEGGTGVQKAAMQVNEPPFAPCSQSFLPTNISSLILP